MQSLEKRNKVRELRKQKKEARKIIERFILCFYQRFCKFRYLSPAENVIAEAE
jgi:hypothetical protein